MSNGRAIDRTPNFSYRSYHPNLTDHLKIYIFRCGGRSCTYSQTTLKSASVFPHFWPDCILESDSRSCKHILWSFWHQSLSRPLFGRFAYSWVWTPPHPSPPHDAAPPVKWSEPVAQKTKEWASKAVGLPLGKRALAAPGGGKGGTSLRRLASERLEVRCFDSHVTHALRAIEDLYCSIHVKMRRILCRMSIHKWCRTCATRTQ